MLVSNGSSSSKKKNLPVICVEAFVESISGGGEHDDDDDDIWNSSTVCSLKWARLRQRERTWLIGDSVSVGLWEVSLNRWESLHGHVQIYCNLTLTRHIHESLTDWTSHALPMYHCTKKPNKKKTSFKEKYWEMGLFISFNLFCHIFVKWKIVNKTFSIVSLCHGLLFIYFDWKHTEHIEALQLSHVVYRFVTI